MEHRLQYHHLDRKQRRQNAEMKMSGALPQSLNVEQRDRKAVTTGKGWMQKERFWEKKEGEKLVYDC